MSSGMMTTMSTTLMPKEGHFLVVDMSTTQRFDFAVEQTEAKVTLFYFPSQTPFFLLAYGSAECQMVKWTVASLEWIFFDTEANRNSDKAGGAYPFEAGIKHPTILLLLLPRWVNLKLCKVLDIARHACLSPGALCKYSYFPS